MLFLHPHFSYLQTPENQAQIVRFEQFSDGWPRIFLEEKPSLEWQKWIYIGNFRHVEDFFGQIAFLDGLTRHHLDSLHIVIPFFPAASMERDTPSGELSIANVFARTFSLIGERLPGRTHIHLFDIHDEREIFYFPPSVQIHHHTTTDILKREVFENPLHKLGVWRTQDFVSIDSIKSGKNPQSLRDSSSRNELIKPIILFPDAGAKKAFSRYFTDYEIVTCAKVRKWANEIEMFFEGGILEGRDVFIIDDHIRTGGTLVEACRYARIKWARSVSAFVPHAVFAEGVKDEFIEAFDQFYTTDSIPMNRDRFSSIESAHVLSLGDFLQKCF